MTERSSDEDRYVIVVNDEGQHSIWFAGRDVPSGWTTVGQPDTREACLREIETLWTDMRPLSLRKWLDEQQPDS